MFSNELAITWRLFGDPGDYLAISDAYAIIKDTFYPRASVSSVQSVFYRISTKIEDDKKPQINADERRCFPASEFIKIIHRKGRKERKAMQEPLCPLCSPWLNAFSTPVHESTPPAHAVHLRPSRAGE